MGVFHTNNILELFHKTGAAGFLGKNQAPLSAKDGPEARGKNILVGRCSSWLIELVYQRKANDGLFYIEGALENQDEPYSPLSYLRLDTGALVSSLTPLTLSSSTRMLLSIPHTLCLPYLRPVCFTQGAVDPKDEFFIRTLERQGSSRKRRIIKMKVIWIRNLSLTLVLLTLCLLFLAKKQPQIAGSLALSIVTLWLHNGRSLPPKPPSFARALLPKFMLFCLFFTSCQTKETAPLSLLDLLFLGWVFLAFLLFSSREKQTSASGTLILLGGSHD